VPGEGRKPEWPDPSEKMPRRTWLCIGKRSSSGSSSSEVPQAIHSQIPTQQPLTKSTRMHFARFIAISIVDAIGMLCFSPPAVAAIPFAEGTIWELSGTATEERWLELHLIEGEGQNAVYHVSILSRHVGDPVWKLTHVVPHMAITDAALRRSVIRLATRKRASYPETYDGAYRQWLQLQAKGNAPICVTSVIECAHL
jgi:hypothetical protein